jgi:hypothetical protein
MDTAHRVGMGGGGVAVKMVGNGLAGPSKMDFVETIKLLYVRFCNFEG